MRYIAIGIALSLLVFAFSCRKDTIRVNLPEDCIKHISCCDGSRDDMLVAWCPNFRKGKWARMREYNPDTIEFINDTLLNWTNQYGGMKNGKYQIIDGYLHLYQDFQNNPYPQPLPHRAIKYTYYTPETKVFTIVAEVRLTYVDEWRYKKIE